MTHTEMHAYMHTYIHTRIHTYIYTYIYTHRPPIHAETQQSRLLTVPRMSDWPVSTPLNVMGPQVEH